VGALEWELAVLTRRIETAGRRAELHRDLDRAGYVLARTVDALGSPTVGELAERLGLDGSTVTRQLDTLEARGFVEREIDKVDRRARVVRLTAAGRRAVQRSRAARRQRLDGALSDWTIADVQTFSRLLRRFNQSLAGTESVAGTPRRPSVN
jgi:DNA-binding MarR family transcriptional regulator